MYFLFPTVNLQHFVKESIFDPFEVDKKLVIMPVDNFTQAYHLFTCGPVITQNDWINAQQLGEKKLEKAVQKIYERFA